MAKKNSLWLALRGSTGLTLVCRVGVERQLCQSVKIGDVGAVGDEATKDCVNWGLLLYKRWPSVSSFSCRPSRPFQGLGLGGAVVPHRAARWQAVAEYRLAAALRHWAAAVCRPPLQGRPRQRGPLAGWAVDVLGPFSGSASGSLRSTSLSHCMSPGC